MNDEIKIPTMKITPLKKICMTIGELPTSYLETMTYYEMLVWFTNYLRDSIIPAVNNNAEAVHELQVLFVELQTYVNDYFDNLDVQDEINNKLDQMLEDGVLEQIIEQFIQSTAIWGFDTVADMKSSTNLINGSFAKTLGYYNIDDGGSALYKITDTIDENAFQETLDNDLYATLITDFISPEQLGAYGDGIHDDSEALTKTFTSGKHVKLNNKTYILKQAITNANVLSITGNGGTIKWENHLTWSDKNYTNKWNYDVKDAIKFTNIANLKIDNLILKSNKNDEEILTWNGLVLENCSNATMINSEITGFNWCGLSLTNCIYSNVNNSKFYENRYGIYNNSTNSIIDSNEISNHFSESEEYETYGAWISNSTQDSRYYDGIIEYGTNSIISNNIIFDNGQSGIYSNSSSNISISNNTIYDNWNIGVDLGAVTNQTEITKANVIGNNVKNNKVHQINLTRVNHSLITNNNVIVTDTSNQSYGIILTTAETNYNSISYNKIEITANNSNRGISLDANTHHNSIVFNDIIAPLDHNVTYDSSNVIVAISKNINELLYRAAIRTGISVAASASVTIDISQYNLKTNGVYFVNLRGSNSYWNAFGVLYVKGSGGGSSLFYQLHNSQVNVTLTDDNTLTVENTNASYPTSLILTISGEI